MGGGVKAVTERIGNGFEEVVSGVPHLLCREPCVLTAQGLKLEDEVGVFRSRPQRRELFSLRLRPFERAARKDETEPVRGLGLQKAPQPGHQLWHPDEAFVQAIEQDRQAVAT